MVASALTPGVWHDISSRSIDYAQEPIRDGFLLCLTSESLFSTRKYFHELIMSFVFAWWRHHMETFSALLAISAGNSPVAGEFPAQRPVTRSFDAFFDLGLNERQSKQSWGWWFETPSRPLWRHSNGSVVIWIVIYEAVYLWTHVH